MVEFIQVAGTAEIDRVAALARQTWEHHYIPIIGRKQTEYMLVNFQSVPAIARQIASGYDYYLLKTEGRSVGYFALVHNAEAQSTLLSKIYVHPERQGEGLGRRIVAFAEECSLARGGRELWLTVNRNNVSSIAFYEQVGFQNAGALVQDIGHGFVMDDFKMIKTLSATAVA
ncbi:MAG: GNAT family N-acetyltransferase [Deltaproteobacteria bacterium]|nr:GNAT family N-acetyltransferase [Deltaproteobacteria bacterium]